MSKLTISDAAKLKGVSVSTLRRWESEGKLIPEKGVVELFCAQNRKIVEELKDVATRIQD